jgi:hypothetical protein
MTKEQLIIEVSKCLKSTPYALRTYLQTYDNTVQKYVPLDLFPDQETLIEDYDSFNENIALKYRQAGVSTVTAAWASKKLVFAKKNKPEKILIIANKLDTAVEMANKVRSFTEQWPSWVGVTFSQEKNSQRHFKLTNDCEVKAVATSKDALRGYTPTILIFDEAAYIDADSDFWAACMASLSTGGKVIVISTPNGYDEIYYGIYDQALRGDNDFKITEMFWYRDPRYTKDLYLVKTKDLTHFLLNRDQYGSDAIIDMSMENPNERDFGLLQKYIEDGYKPCSSWFEGMVKKLKYDKRKVSQELECLSGDSLITLRDKNTGIIEIITIGELYNKLLLMSNTKYEILTPNGFEPFDGVQKLKKKTIELFFNNGKTLRGSSNHQVFDCENHPKILAEIKVGDKIKSKESFLVVERIKKYNYETNVYDIINSGRDHIFYSNDVISHNCDFLGSGDKVFATDVLENIGKNMIREPQAKLMGNSLWIFKEPENNHKYVMGVDVSRGDSEDYSSIEIIDFDTREQVLEYVAKVPPDVIAEIAYKWGSMYNAYCVIDITGGMGVSTARKMQEMNYSPGLYVDNIETKDKWKWDPKLNDRIPGLNFNSKRVQIIASFEESVRHEFKIYSKRLFNEMNTFIYRNGRPDHQKGQHDDCIMSIAMAIYVAEKSFQSLQKVVNHTKAMVNSWTTFVSENKNSSEYFNPMIPQSNPSFKPQNQPSVNDYKQYGWLFGVK